VPPAFYVVEANANKDWQSQHWHTVWDFFGSTKTSCKCSLSKLAHCTCM